MMIVKLPLTDKYAYINLDKVLYFEATKTNCTELHLDSGESLILPIDPEELLSFLAENPIDNDTLLLNQSDISKMFK